ncbi:MAG: hypothetical protein ACLS6G_02315 [Christensenellales bacterium]
MSSLFISISRHAEDLLRRHHRRESYTGVSSRLRDPALQADLRRSPSCLHPRVGRSALADVTRDNTWRTLPQSCAA